MAQSLEGTRAILKESRTSAVIPLTMREPSSAVAIPVRPPCHMDEQTAVLVKRPWRSALPLLGILASEDDSETFDDDTRRDRFVSSALPGATTVCFDVWPEIQPSGRPACGKVVSPNRDCYPAARRVSAALSIMVRR